MRIFDKLRRVYEFASSLFCWNVFRVPIELIAPSIAIKVLAPALISLLFINTPASFFAGLLSGGVLVILHLLLSIAYDNDRKFRSLVDRVYGRYIGMKNYIWYRLNTDALHHSNGFVFVALSIVGGIPIWVFSQYIGTPVSLEFIECTWINSIACLFAVMGYPKIRESLLTFYRNVLSNLIWKAKIEIAGKNKLLPIEYYTIKADDDTENYLGRIGLYDNQDVEWDTRSDRRNR